MGKVKYEAVGNKGKPCRRKVHNLVYIIKVDVTDTFKAGLGYFLKPVCTSCGAVYLFVIAKLGFNSRSSKVIFYY